jgi:subtilisin-like proprotein convertase family protein
MFLSLAFAFALDLRLELVRESLTGTHCRYRQYVDGFPTDDYVTVEDRQSCLSGQAGLPVLHHHWVRDRLARRVIHDDYIEDYDAESGALLRRIPLFFNATKPARVFDPNPVVALNDPSLQDRNDANVIPDAAYKNVQLQDVADSGPLRGPYVTLVDMQAPTVPPPDASGSLIFNRADDGFEDVNAYFHIDTTQRYLQSIGYTGRRAIAPYAIETDAHARSGLDNSLFLADPFHPGIGTLFFGTGGVDDAEDADLVVHEYGHAIHEWIAPSSFSGTFSSEARAFSEAFGDYWAWSNHYAQRVQSGRDPFCFADWDPRCWTDDSAELCGNPPNTNCLRRLDSPHTMADYQRIEGPGIPHENGQIMSSALREIFLAIGKPVTDTIVIESIFGAPSLPTFAVMARRMIDADQLLYGGTHKTTICAAMASRGILTSDQCAIVPRGEWTYFASGERGIAIPEAEPNGIASHVTITDARAIEKLFVRVDIAHPSRGDLRIELVAPDGTSVVLQQISVDRARDIHVTYGIDATPATSLDVFRGKSAAGTWTLRVIDQILQDTGTLQSWDLVIQFAGDAPAVQRPRNARAQMIPAIGHRFGANDTFFASDLRIANPSNAQKTATLIFTRDGNDGREKFSAVNIVLAPGETVAYDDVLERVFHTSGIGSLEVLGDVIVMSRTYMPLTSGGTVGQSVPPNLETTGLNDGLLTVNIFPLSTHRSRVGVVETAGVPATVLYSLSLEIESIDVPAFGHVQLPIAGFFQQSFSFGTSTPGARVAVYITQIDNTNGDAMFIPAVRGRQTTVTRIAPVADTTGVNANAWRSDLLLGALRDDITFVDGSGGTVTRQLTGFRFFPEVLTQTFGRTNTSGILVARIPPPGVGTATRMVNGTTSEYVPFVDPVGPAEQHLVFIESTDAFRTNVGFVANEPAVAEVIIFDSAGHELDRRTLDTPRGIAQMAVTQRVVNGRALVRFLSGTGRAYASMIDNVTGDAATILGQ